MRMLAAAVCLLALALAGCAGGADDDDGAPVQPGTTTSQATGGASSAASTSSSSAPAVADYNVELYDSRFDPTSMSVPNYQKVVFENKGALTHTVTIVRQGDAVGTTYRDQPVQTGSTVDFNFPNDGTYIVYCRYHGSETSGMHMTITV